MTYDPCGACEQGYYRCYDARADAGGAPCCGLCDHVFSEHTLATIEAIRAGTWRGPLPYYPAGQR